MKPNFIEQMERLKKDPSVSSWLKNALTELNNRDPVDAVNDAELLNHLMDLRMKELTEKVYG